jgi:hypothetical protein
MDRRCKPCGGGYKTEHPQTHLVVGSLAICVDQELTQLLTLLWDADIQTRFSCQGNPNSTHTRDLVSIMFQSQEDSERYYSLLTSKLPAKLKKLLPSNVIIKKNNYSPDGKPPTGNHYTIFMTHQALLSINKILKAKS